MKRIAITILCLFMTSAVQADVILYLYPSVAGSESLNLGTIAMIDGSAADRASVSSIEIPSSMYADGYLDRRELQRFVSTRAGCPVTVIGSAVKVNLPRKTGDPVKLEGITRGKTVKVIYRSGTIRIEVRGTAMGRGLPGETIAVRVKRRIIRAVVIDGERVKKEI